MAGQDFNPEYRLTDERQVIQMLEGHCPLEVLEMSDLTQWVLTFEPGSSVRKWKEYPYKANVLRARGWKQSDTWARCDVTAPINRDNIY